MRLLLTTFMALAMIGPQSFGGKVPEKVAVFWIPSRVETYVPVTMENIEQRAFKVVSIKNDRQAGQVLSLIRRTNRKLDSKKIRVKISTSGGFYNFDAAGLGVSSTGEAVKIDIRKLQDVLCE